VLVGYALSEFSHSTWVFPCLSSCHQYSMLQVSGSSNLFTDSALKWGLICDPIVGRTNNKDVCVFSSLIKLEM